MVSFNRMSTSSLGRPPNATTTFFQGNLKSSSPFDLRIPSITYLVDGYLMSV